MRTKEIYVLIIVFCLAITGGCEKKFAEEERKVVINEIMPANSSVVSDPAGEYDDWIELYNMTGDDIDISGWYLSDSENNYTKFRFPESARISAYGFLIIWADDDISQSRYHAGFKLAAEGEKVILSYPDGEEVDKISYPAQSLELSFSRFPDGTGEFIWQLPTFARSNNLK